MPAADMSFVSFSCGSHCQNIIAATGFPSWYSPGAPFSSATRHPAPNAVKDAMHIAAADITALQACFPMSILFPFGVVLAGGNSAFSRRDAVGYLALAVVMFNACFTAFP